MNILYALHYYPVYGGGETVTVTLANEMTKRGHNVHIAYSVENKSAIMPYLPDSRIKELRLQNTFACLKEDVQALNTYILEEKIDVLVLQWANAELLHKARIGTNCKFVICWHSVLIRENEPRFIVKKIIKQIFPRAYSAYDRLKQIRNHNKNYNFCDKYIFLCYSFAEQYKRVSGKRDGQGKISFMHNPNTIGSVQINFSQKAKEVLFVGRILEMHKRISYILKIWQIIEKSGKHSDWKLSIVGSGEDLPRTKKQSDELNLKNVAFYDFQNPKPFYERSSLFLMTSKFEGFGMTLIEAQSYGCVPIVMNSVPVFHDIIDSMQNGILTPNNDITAFAEKLQLLMDNRNLREEMAKNAMESVKKFSTEKIVDKWEKLFEELKK